MEILAKQPSTKGSAEMFTGDVWYDVIAKGEGPSRIRVNIVRFAPGAHTAWHSHANGQTLHVTDGRASSNPAVARPSRSAPATPSTPRPTSGTGTVPLRTTSCPTSPCGKASVRARTGRKPSGATR
jgi:hypothetical protein